MASHSVSWVLDTHVRFGDLDFIVTMEGELRRLPLSSNLSTSLASTRSPRRLRSCSYMHRRPAPLGSYHLLSFDYGRLDRQLGAFLGPRPSREDLRRLTSSFANVMTQLTGGEPLSPEYLV